MADTKVYVDVIGTVIFLDAREDISAATVLEIRYLKPISNRTGSWVATLSGTTKLKYVTEKSDLDEAGVWKLQCYIETPSWAGLGETVELEVFARFDLNKD